MRRWTATLTVLGAALTLCASTPLAAQPRNADLVWRTVRTRHFEVTYHEPLGIVARHVAAAAERAHDVLAPILEHEPDERTHVLLTDNSDSANGSANAVPYNVIRLFATGPEDLSALSDYDDWLGELVTHEHTHVLHLDTISGVPALINAIFGKVYPPNAVQPRWFLEGIAVHQESAHSAGGRLRSTLFDMYVRMDALGGTLLGMDQISSGVNRWPHGNVPYLYGSQFVRFIADRHGDEALARMSHDYGGQLVPYGINRTARRATGRTFVELYEDWRAHATTRARRIAAEVRARGIRAGVRITHHGEVARYPRFLDRNTVVYFANDGQSRGQLRTIDARTGADPGRLALVAGTGVPSPHPDGTRVVFSGIGIHHDVYFFNELYSLDRRSGDVEPLTSGMRAREPDVSPDGRHVAYVVNGASTSHLAVAELADVEDTHRVLVRSRRFEQAYTPRWSPDGRTLAFSAWRTGGYRDIVLVDVASGRTTSVTRDRALDTGPTWAPDGRHLYFSSDRTGIANVYAYDTTADTTMQVTNVVGGAFQPVVSPDGTRLVYVGYSRIGFDLWSMPLDPDGFSAAVPYEDTRPESPPPSRALPLVSEPYEPLDTLLPRSWMLELGQDGFGSQLAVTFDQSDLVGYHAYAGRVGVGLVEGNVNADLRWRYQRTPVPIGFRVFRSVNPRPGLVVAGERRDWIEEAVGGEVSASYSLPGPFHNETLRLGYALSHIGKARPFGGELDPNDPPPTLPRTGLLGSVGAGWTWNDVARQTFDIAPSSGTALSLSLGIAHPYFGSQFEVVTASWAVAHYEQNPLFDHHVLAFRYAGGLSGGDSARPGTFAVGGFPDVEVLDAIVDNVVLGGQALRGYPPFTRVGPQFHLFQLEYRFPLFRFYRGLSSLPTYLNRMYGLVFLDYGDAFGGRLDVSTFRFGTGGEVLTTFTLGYFLTYTLRIGLARGLNEGGETQVYGHLGVPF